MGRAVAPAREAGKVGPRARRGPVALGRMADLLGRMAARMEHRPSLPKKEGRGGSRRSDSERAGATRIGKGGRGARKKGF